MTVVPALFYLLLHFTGQAATLDCAAMQRQQPVYSKDPQAKAASFRAKYGEFALVNWNDPAHLERICELGTATQTGLPFDHKTMTPFVVHADCSVTMGLPGSSKRPPPHAVLAAEESIIGGGMLRCVRRHNGDYIFLSNRSNRYCFPMEPLAAALQTLKEAGISPERVRIRYDRAKFCAYDRKRSERLEEIAAQELMDYGYKQSHVYRGDRFLQLKGIHLQ